MDKISYQKARELIHSGDIVFIDKRGHWYKRIMSTVVEFFTRSKFSHVGIAFWVKISGKDRLMVIEAQPGAKRKISNLSTFENEYLYIIKAPVPWNDYAAQAMSEIGEVPYGYFEAGYVGVREFLMKYTKHIVLLQAGFPGEICSEFVARMISLPERHISPQLLFERLIGLGHVMRCITK